MDTDLEIPHSDSNTIFWVKGLSRDGNKTRDLLWEIHLSWPEFGTRYSLEVPDSLWVRHLSEHVEGLMTQRIGHVEAWINVNLPKASKSNAAIEDLHRAMDAEIVEMRRAVQLCRDKCENCHFLCLYPRFHDGDHHCHTDHKCKHYCQFDNANLGLRNCSLPYVNFRGFVVATNTLLQSRA